MRFMGTGEIGTDPIGQLVGREQARGFDNGALAVDPFRFDGIEPGTLDRQLIHQQPDSRTCPLDGLIVLANPGAHGLADVPRRVVPDQNPDGHVLLLQPGTTPLQELDGDGAHRAPFDKAQPDGLAGLRRVGHQPLAIGTQQHPIAGEGFGIRIGGRDRLFHQPQRVLDVSPGVQMRLLLATPPHLVGKAEPPVGVLGRQLDQPVAAAFFFGCTPDRGW